MSFIHKEYDMSAWRRRKGQTFLGAKHLENQRCLGDKCTKGHASWG